MVAKPLCPLYKNIIKSLDRARYPELRYNLLVSQKKLRILHGTALEEIGPCHMVLEQEDAVIVSVIDTAILFQESETPLEIRDFSTIGTHWGLAENGDANQPEYHYKKQLPQNQKILLLT